MTRSFAQGQRYTRDDVADAIGLDAFSRKGNWMTGYSRVPEGVFIFCNVGVPGRTGHDYDNQWDGDELIWYGKTRSHKDQPLMREMIRDKLPVHVFWRAKDRARFTYAGLGKAIEVSNSVPVQIRWSFA